MKRSSIILALSLFAPHAIAGVTMGGSSGTSGGNNGQGGDKRLFENSQKVLELPSQSTKKSSLKPSFGVGDLVYTIPNIDYDALKDGLLQNIEQGNRVTVDGKLYDLISASQDQVILRSEDGHKIVVSSQNDLDGLSKKEPLFYELNLDISPLVP